ncbi:uncharacterized protein LOC124607652 [Schistocerca americana]|uniref:uncharacterized protein LOC124607652 n=1 Tax=Schistocerca americana TaxID=7009 RepID=UPI001F4F3F39|nr:uncharacterized protein LOC124607652 [Schistocerca americana]
MTLINDFSNKMMLLRLSLLLVMLPYMEANWCLTNRKEVSPKRFMYYQGRTSDIHLEASDRITHQLASHIFKIFLEEVLGYAYVSVVKAKEYSNETEILGHLSVPLNGSSPAQQLPPSMINVEVWLPAQYNAANYSEYYGVKDCGLIAPPGRFGWFIPSKLSYMTPGMDHWKFFTNPKEVSIFDVKGDKDMDFIRKHMKDKSANSYYCRTDFCENGIYSPDWCSDSTKNNTANCALLLAGYPGQTAFVVDHIRELRLYVKVAWLGPNLKNVTETLTNSYVKSGVKKSLIILSWTPSLITAADDDDFTLVTFPECNPFSSHTEIGCKYELHRLTKFAWSKIKDGATPAYQALLKMTFSREDYQNLLKIYKKTSNKHNISSIACAWMHQNEEVWESWIPRLEDKNVLHIGGIFPISSSSSSSAKGIVRAVQLAFVAINRNESVLRDYVLQPLLNDGQCAADKVMKIFIDYILYGSYNTLAGILGPACSDTVEPLAGVTKYYKTVVISYSAEGSSFSDRTKYPYFFRTIGDNQQYTDVYLSLFKRLNWTRVAALTEDGQKYTEYISHLQDLLQSNDIQFVTNRKFPRDRNKDAMAKYLLEFKSKNVRIIIGDVYDHAARSLMCEAYRQEMTAKQGYVWFLPLWLDPDWYDTERHPKENLTCTKEQMVQAINGHLALSHAYFAPNDSIMQENKTVGQWMEQYKNACNTTNGERMSNYGGYAYDAVWTYALALDKLWKENQSHFSNIHNDSTTRRFVDLIGETDFNGVSGHINFRGRPSRITTVNIVQWRNYSTYIVGSFKPNISEDNKPRGGTLHFNESAVVWLSSDGKLPSDGTEPPSVCYVQGLADGLGVTCEIAVVVANVIGFSILGILLIIAFIFVKRRYEKKVQLTKRYMEHLGIDLLSASNLGTLDKWEIPRDRVVINRKLGEGAFGTVYGGEAHFAEKGWVAVAVKTLKVGSSTEEKLDFLSEAEVMKRFEHKNIVKLLGVCTKNEPVYTVMEFMLYGDLKTFLLARRHLVNDRLTEESDEVSSKKLTSMALDVARALSYLADLKFVHRDVASRNCLVNAARVVKLGDFGMTRPMFENDYYKFNRKGMLPVRWMAPESLELGIFTPSSDVWSYGVLLYEIITFGSFPFQGLSNNQVLEHVKAGNTIQIPTGVKPQLEALIRSCWNKDYKRRPNASEIVEFLANNPRLLSPCLDMPLASVQMEDTGQLEMHLPERFRKCSLTASLLQSNSELSNGCVREPLLSSKYITAHQDDEDFEDEYCGHDPPGGIKQVDSIL